jgi:hypothetical protein
VQSILLGQQCKYLTCLTRSAPNEPVTGNLVHLSVLQTVSLSLPVIKYHVWSSGCTVPCVFGGRWGGQPHAPIALSRQNRFRYPSHRRLRGPRSQSRRCGGKKRLLRLLEMKLRFLGRPTSGVVCAQTGLSQLLCLYALVYLLSQHY